MTGDADQPKADDDRLEQLLDVLRQEIWPLTTGAAPITKQDREAILGYTPRASANDPARCHSAGGETIYWLKKPNLRIDREAAAYVAASPPSIPIYR